MLVKSGCRMETSVHPDLVCMDLTVLVNQEILVTTLDCTQDCIHCHLERILQHQASSQHLRVTTLPRMLEYLLDSMASYVEIPCYRPDLPHQNQTNLHLKRANTSGTVSVLEIRA